MFILALALFGEWLGGFNLESDAKQIPLADRYAKLPAGIWEYYSNKGVFLLVTMIVVNSVILFRHRHEKKSRQILTLLVYILLFSTLYTLALPLGGYRFYRPNIIRRDLYEPVSILLVLYFGLSAFHVWRNIAPRYKLLYRAFIVVPLLHFVSVTFNGAPDNSCEKNCHYEDSCLAGKDSAAGRTMHHHGMDKGDRHYREPRGDWHVAGMGRSEGGEEILPEIRHLMSAISFAN